MNFFLIFAIFFYLVGTVEYLIYMVIRSRNLWIFATVTILVGFFLHTASLAEISIDTGRGPYSTKYEQLLFGSWTVFGTFLIAIAIYKVKTLGAFITPLGLLLIILSFLFPSDSETKNIVAHQFWLTLHKTISFIYFSAFAVTFASGLMYLLQERSIKLKKFGAFFKLLPSLATSENLNRVGLTVGLPLVMISFVSASLWSMEHYGEFMREDISLIPMMISILIYLVLFFGRNYLHLQGHKTAYLSILGFVIMLLSLVRHI